MGRINKLLLSIFLVLLLVTVSEVIYYLRTNNTSSLVTMKTSQDLREGTVPQVPQSTILRGDTLRSANQALNQETLSNLQTLRKSIVRSSLLTNRYKGTITIINTKGGTVNSPSYLNKKPFTYKIQLQIQGIPGEKKEFSEDDTFYYNEKQAKAIRVITKKDTTQIPLSLDELKVGDRIDVQETIDLLKASDDNRTEVIITKE